MKPELFAELLTSANQALDHARGKRSLRTTSLPQLPKPMTARQVRNVRGALQASQALLARYLNVSAKLVQAWEGERRTPSGPALVLLRIIEQEPGLIDLLYGERGTNGNHRGRNGAASRRRKVAAR